VNLGGGYKVARMPSEKSTDILLVGAPVKAVRSQIHILRSVCFVLQMLSGDISQAIESFAVRTGRKLKLEIEPGTFLVANAGSLLCSVQVKICF
jgi:diaminopimelate decarboxylase